MKSTYFAYIYLDTRKPGTYVYNDLVFNYEPFYVGMGQNNRHLSHINDAKLVLSGYNPKITNKAKHNKIVKMLLEELEPIIIKYASNLTIDQAKNLEKLYISKIGRLDLKTGPLTNRTNGGEATSGLIHSDETKELWSRQRKGKRSEAQLAASARQRKIPLSETHKRNISISQKGVRRLTDEQYSQIAIKNTGKKRSDETKELWSRQRKGKRSEAQLAANRNYTDKMLANIMPLDEFKVYFSNTNVTSAREWMQFYRENKTPDGVYCNPVEAYKKRKIYISWNELLGRN